MCTSQVAGMCSIGSTSEKTIMNLFSLAANVLRRRGRSTNQEASFTEPDVASIQW